MAESVYKVIEIVGTSTESWEKAAKAAVDIPVILVGGLRSTQVMDDVIRSGDADFLALARPFVREPDLVNQIAQGRRGSVDCVSCNICFQHEGIDPLRCWRTPSAMLAHVYGCYLKDFHSHLRARWGKKTAR